MANSQNGSAATSPSKDETEAASYKAAAVATVKEYLSSSDVQEVSSTLSELQQPHLAYIFVKQVSFGLAYCANQKGMICRATGRGFKSCCTQQQLMLV